MSKFIKSSFSVSGISCTSCAASIEAILSSGEGIKSAVVNYAALSVNIEYDPSLTSPEKMKTMLVKAGYDLIIESDENLDDIIIKNYLKLKKKVIGAWIFTIPVIFFGMFFMHEPFTKWISLVLTIPVIFIFGNGFFIRAFAQIKRLNTSMDTLVAASTGIAFLFSLFNTLFPQYWTARGLDAHIYYEAATAIISFVLLGKLLEEKAIANTSSAIKKLIKLQPDEVSRQNSDGTFSIISVKDLKINDIVLVKPGERIAVDGQLVDGKSFVDESLITGEPLHVEKNIGDKVFAGTINQKGSFTFTAQKLGEDTLLSGIIKLVKEAQTTKAPVQKLVDKIASYFVPIVFSISIITFILWLIFGGENALSHALITSITVLVISCPCALGLATPTAIMVGIGKAAEKNILIKDAESLELAKKINVVILDKTGTITEGKPVVTEIIRNKDAYSDNHDNILFSMESKSEHPLAEAIVRHLEINKPTALTPESFESLTGYGIKASFNDQVYYIGNSQLITINNINTNSELQKEAEKLKLEAKTIMYFADDKNTLAIIAVSDKIKPTSASAIYDLQKKGIEVILLTGDNYQTAKVVADATGITSFKADMLPEDKFSFIKDLQSKNKVVAMVGDGINDSPALAQADVSIAMGKGSDIAINVAKVTIINSDLKFIAKTIEISKQTVATIKENLFWAFIYNLIGIPIAAGAFYAINGFLLNPAFAAAAMAFSSISVVLNSLRLKYKK